MSRHKRHRRAQNRKIARPTRVTPSSTTEQDWSRAGAHNIAGVIFQVAVTASLLLQGRAGELPVTRATPEGYEDIDVEFSDETRALVQVKERSPNNRFTQSELADALGKKSTALAEDPRCHFVLATNATLGRGLSPTGWGLTLSQCIGKVEVDGLASHLEASFDDPYEILARTHILEVEGSVVDGSRHDFARILALHPSVAGLAYARLIEQITEVAVRQRRTTPETAEWVAPSDLDTLATRVLQTVDVQSLDEAVRTGIVEPVDFSVRADLSQQDFLAGVDVLPSHIAADLDLPRPTELSVIITALEEQHSALLTGPSGAGKSALLWRTARKLAGHGRPYRLLRLRPEDVPALSRWIRLQEPSKNFPLLLCADNLGRPHTAGWTAVAREFMDSPGVLFLGACREEDYRPELVVGRTTIIDPKLDRELAVSIAETLVNRQVQTALDVTEAFEASDNLLMEFLSMLLTGRRLRQVVEEQVSARFEEERYIEREILRYVTTAHAAGVSLPAEVLGTLIPGSDLAPALAQLDREHILIPDDESRWQGLHELRSRITHDYLHKFPPPTSAATIRHLVEHLPTSDACRIIEEYARLDADLVPAAEAVSEILSSRGVGAEDGAQLASSLAMADAYRHARECLRVIEDRRPSRIDPETVLLLAYSHRFAGVSLDSLRDNNPGFSRLIALPEALPARPPSLRDMSLRTLSSETVYDIATRGTPDQAIEWLETLEGSLPAHAVPIENIWAHFSGARIEVAARLSATLQALASVDGVTPTTDPFGDFHNRMRWLANDLPDCVGIDSRDEPDGKVVTLRLLVPSDEATLNDQSVQACRSILDLCPEADIAEVIVLNPSGERHSISGFEPGCKRIPRSNLPRPPITAGNANFIRAGRLLLASNYWTEPIRVLAETSKQLLELRDDAVAWLINPHHNKRRRREAVTLADSLTARLAAGPREPVSDDDTRDRNRPRKALNGALSALRDVAAGESLDDPAMRRLGARCRDAVKCLRAARQNDLPKLSTIGDPLPDSLDEMFTLLADVLLASAERHALSPKRLRRRPSESWGDVARRFVDAVASTGYQAERKALKGALAATALNYEVERIRNPDLESVRLLTDWWVLLVVAEDNPSVEDDSLAPPVFADHLETDMAEQLAFRTFFVFSAAERVLPLNSIKLGGSQFWPADEDELSIIASGLGTEVMKSVNLENWDAFVAELIGASRAASLLRMRKKATFPSDEEGFRAQLVSARNAAGKCHPILLSEAEHLLGRVEQEPHGDGKTLAGEVYHAVTHTELNDDVNELNELRIAALYIDL